MTEDPKAAAPAGRQFVQALGLLDSTMIVAGSMIGSGIFIVSADIARQVGSGGWLLVVWLVTGALTVAAALSYGELAAMMPQAGGQYIYLRQAYSPLWGFLYGWTLFLVIQTGTIAAVAVGLARFLGVLLPAISSTRWLIPPVDVSAHYAVSLSTQQLAGILVIVLLTAVNSRGVKVGTIIQNTFTSAKVLSLAALIGLGLGFARNRVGWHASFGDFWTPQGVEPIRSDLAWVPAASSLGVAGMFVAICAAQVGSLFSADAWNNITFIAGEVKNPRRNIPLALVLGSALVITLYLLVNVAYLCMLPVAAIQHAPDDRVATAAIGTVFGGGGAVIMAAAIVISTFGCNNGIILAGARVYYAMARDRLFFRSTGRLNAAHVPAVGLWLQCIWACLLVLPRTRLRNAISGAEEYGNLYSNLLDYVIFAVLIFYILTVTGVFVLRRTRPDAPRPYRAWGYPLVPAAYLVMALAIAVVLLLYKTQTTWPGLLIVLAGVPVYFLWRPRAAAVPAADA
ncbi:MAG: amino acid permease [Verrucomicrobiota bacterium]